jgi:multiple sugar transport system ATP-binding protein
VAEIQLVDLQKTYADGTYAVKGVNLTIHDGEFVVLVGPSGCGKTSVLRMVAGLEEVTEGEVRIGGRSVNDLLPKHRDIAMVFQNYALYPHMNVYDNMAFGLRQRRLPKTQIDKRVREAARVLGLDETLLKKPRTLSGGQRQRVAMGRAIVREPQAFLMDEPLSNLDAKLRVEMRVEILHLQRRLSVTTMYVTHDQTEAMTMGDRVAVMRGGLVQQVDTPQRLYDEPANLFVAEFIGSPKMNLFEAELVNSDGVRARFGSHELRLGARLLAERPQIASRVGSQVVLGVRPEDMRDAELERDVPPGATLHVVPELREEMGPEALLHFRLDVPPVLRSDVLAAAQGDDGTLPAPEMLATPFVARVSREARAREGEPVELAVSPDRLYLFDVQSGEAI